MSSESALTKRIKRHVVGRTRTYFAATAPGFENVCFNELNRLELSGKAASVVSGGVEFQGQLQDCYIANLNLRSANRILMRIQTIFATHFSLLEKKLADIPWELYLRAGQLPAIHVTTKHCKLYHSQAISERLLAVIADRMKKNDFIAPDEKLTLSTQKIYARGIDDRFTLSIDSSGEHLYKRGIKKHTGAAPLRETSAAAALMIAGYTGSEPLIDPMCGTGTFALEAALMAKNIPPGWFRKFAFMGWPSYRPKRWEYLKGQCQNVFINLKRPMIWASDADEATCSKLRECIAEFNLPDAVNVSHTNFFELLPADLTDQTGLITINPPYGRRLGSRAESQRLYKTICERLKQHYQGWNVVLIAPDKNQAKRIPFELQAYPVSHGGLKAVLMTGRIA
jgi:putative N6-adenine-specific DNA methylase